MLFITSTSNIIPPMLRLVTFQAIMSPPAIEPAVKPGEILNEMLLIPADTWYADGMGQGTAPE